MFDCAGKNRDGTAIDPVDRLGALAFAKVIVIADLRDFAIGHDEGAIAVAAERSVGRRIDQEPAKTKRAGLHYEVTSKNSRPRRQKKDSGSARGETTNTKYVQPPESP